MILSIFERNAVLKTMSELLEINRELLLKINAHDVTSYNGNDLSMQQRLKVDNQKVDAMIASLDQLIVQKDPLGIEKYSLEHKNGIKIINKTAAFGTILIIYESRPDVTVEAAAIAFKSGNKLLLKGGKESSATNLKIVGLWHESLSKHFVDSSFITYLNYNRAEMQNFLVNPSEKIDLIVPRGGQELINFVKQHATCPVIVSGRGNNFLYVDDEADLEMAIEIIVTAKTSNISVCNALDKVLVSEKIDNLASFLQKLSKQLREKNVLIIGDTFVSDLIAAPCLTDDNIWFEEFLDYKIVIGMVPSTNEAILKINKYCGGHSAAIVTKNNETASNFMDNVDAAAVYQNASTRFTDGGEFGLGGELAISTDKLHQRGPLGLTHLVTNKWYIYGNGQIK